jgi:outer membrane protein OmpA-like peptidoglycan-associated protein
MTGKRIATSALLLAAGLFPLACGSTAPTRELVDARRAYAEASAGAARTHAPDVLVDARRALDAAEREHADEAGSAKERHLAYVAQRRAQIATAHGESKAAVKRAEQAEAEYTKTLEVEAKTASEELGRTEQELAAESQGRAAEREARLKAERERDAAMKSLAEFASVQEDQRGLVITLSGEVLFKTNESSLRPIAQQRLDQVATALQELDEGQAIVIAGHTDSRGTKDFNRRLSQARAEAVRAYLVSRGVSSQQVMAVGKGEDEPIAGNRSAEGRANNRRVEIILSPPQAQTPPPGAAGTPGPSAPATP